MCGGVLAAMLTPRRSAPEAAKKGVFTVPGDGSLDREAIVSALAAKVGRKEPVRVMNAAG